MPTKMDKSATQQFVRAYVAVYQDRISDPYIDAEMTQNLIDSFPESHDPVLDELRKQELDMQLLWNQARGQLLTYCGRQVAEMNQNGSKLKG